MLSGAVLVTGGTGFAGQHLVARLADEGAHVVAPSRDELDLRDARAVRSIVSEVDPVAVFHLAAFSSPSLSWKNPTEALLGNVEMTVNLLEATRQEAPEAGVVLVGSGQVYGEPDALPVTEDAPLKPGNPYAASKAACDLLGRQYAEGFGMRVVRMRPFNHAGPGQVDEYVLSSLAKQVVEAEVGGRDECLLRTGNPESARDFTDVRDVVRAYVLAAELDPGVFNVCRGEAISVGELIQLVRTNSRVPVRHEVDPARVRDHDVPVVFGSAARLTEATGWRPESSIERTIVDTLDWWRGRLA